MRKQVYELTLDDLHRTPALEFALDEEGVEGQGETTVRPHDFQGQVDPSAGMMVVRARFQLADGTEQFGYLTPPPDDDADLGVLQPVIVVNGGQVMFWHGSMEPARSEMDDNYVRFGKTSSSHVFPVRFHSDVPLACGPLIGEISGFLVLEDWRSGRTRELR